MEIMSIPSTMEEQESGTVIKRLSVPIGLEELMSGLAKEVLHKQPQDIYTFASEHFARLLALRDESSYIQRFASAKFAHTTSEKATQDTKKNLCRQLSVCGAYSEKINNKLNTDNNKDGKRKDRRRRPLRNKTNLLPLKETDSNQNLQRDNKKPLSGDSKKGRKSRRSSSADENAKSLLSESPTKVQKEVSPCEAADLVSKIEVPSIGKTSTENGAETKFVPDAESEETPKDEKTTKKSEEQDLDNDKNDESKKDDFEHQKELSTLEEMHRLQHSSELHDIPVVLAVAEVKESPLASEDAAATKIQSFWRGYAIRNQEKFGMNPSSSSKVNESDDKQDRLRASKSLGDVKDDKTILLARSLSVTDSVISKTLDDDEDKLHSIEDTESEDLGIDSEKLHTGLKEKTNSVLSDEECVPIMDENENTSKVVNLENLTHSSEMHDTLVMQEPILLSNNNTNEDLQHSGEMHDTLTVEHLELHDNLPPTNEIHEVLSSGDKQNVVETSDISGNNEHESKIKESDETDIKNQMSLAQSSNALDNSDAHDEILKENVQIFDSTSPSLNEDLKNDVEKHNLVAPIEIAHSSLISTSEMHDAVPVEDQTSNLTSNDHLNPEESSTMESSSRQDLSHSSEMHDTTVIFDTETKNSNSLAEQQLNPSSKHDTSIDEPITKSASPTLSEQLSDDKESNNTKERDKISTPVLHEDDVNPVKNEGTTTQDPINAADVTKLHSSILPENNLINTSEMHDTVVAEKEVQSDLENLKHSSETHDVILNEDEPKIKSTSIIVNEQLPHSDVHIEEKENDVLIHSGEMHDPIIVVKENVQPDDTQLEHSSETHDVIINKEEPKVKMTNVSLNQQLPHNNETNNEKLSTTEISKPIPENDLLLAGEITDTIADKEVATSNECHESGDVIISKEIPHREEVHEAAVVKEEGLSHNSESGYTAIIEDEPKIDKTTKSLNDQLPHSTEIINDDLSHSSELHDTVIVEKDASLQADGGLSHSSETHDTITSVDEPKIDKTEELLSEQSPHITKSPDLINADLIVAHGAIVDDEDVDSEGVTLKSDAGLSHSSENHDTVISEDESKIDKTERSLNEQSSYITQTCDVINAHLTQNSEAHDETSDKENVESESVTSKIGLGLDHSGETHDTVLSEIEPKINQIEESLNEESPHITETHNLINSDLSQNTEAHDVLVDKEERQSEDLSETSGTHGAIVDKEDVDSKAVTLKSDVGLSHSSESYDTVISNDGSKIDKIEESLNEQSSRITKTPDLINADLSQTSGAHDAVVYKKDGDSESVNLNSDTGLSHSSETHDTVTSSDESKINKTEESLNKQSPHGVINDELTHSTETHVEVGKKENVDSEGLTSKGDAGLNHSSETHDTITYANEPKIDKTEESLSEQSPHIANTPDLINANLCAAHDAVVDKEDVDSESVTLNSDTGLSHSSETHDTITSTDEPKIDKTEESLNVQSPYDVIDDELAQSTEAHADVGKTENVKTEGVTSKSGAGLSNSEAHDTLTSADEPKIDKTEESLSEQSPHIANTPDLINGNLSQTSAAHDAVVDKEDVDSEGVTLNSDTGLSHSSETHDTVTSSYEPKINKTEESLNEQSLHDVINVELTQNTEAHVEIAKNENAEIEGVTSKGDADLSHSSETHDTIASADEPKVDKIEESLSEQSPHIANTPDLINGDLSQTGAVHDAVVDKEDVDGEGVTLNSDTGLSHSSETHDTIASADEPKIDKIEGSLSEQSPHIANTPDLINGDLSQTGAVHDAVVDKEDVDGEGVTLNSDTCLSHSSETHDTIASADEPKIDKVEESLSEQSPHIANTPDLMNADFSQNREAHNAVVDKYVDSKSVTLKDDAGLSRSSETHDTVTSADELEIDKTEVSSHITKTHDVINDDLNQSIEVGEKKNVETKGITVNAGLSHSSETHDIVISEHESKIEKTEESLSEQSLPVTKTPDSINTDFSQTSGTHDAITDKEDVDSVTLKSDAGLSHSSETHDTIISENEPKFPKTRELLNEKTPHVTEINDGGGVAHSNDMHDAIAVEEKLQSDNYSSTVINEEEPNIKVSNIILNQQTPQNSDNIDNGKEEPLPKNLDSLDSSYHSDAVPIEEPIVKSVSTTLNEQLPHNNQTHSEVSENEKSNLILHDDVSHSDNMHDTIKSKKESEIENNSTANTYHISDTSDTLDEEKPSNGTHSIDLDNPKELQTTNIILNKNQEDAVVQDDFNIKKTVSALNKIVPSEDNILEKDDKVDDTNDSNTSKNVLEEKDELPIQTQLKESLNQINETHLPVVTNEEPASTKSPKLPENLDQTDNPAIMEEATSLTNKPDEEIAENKKSSSETIHPEVTSMILNQENLEGFGKTHQDNKIVALEEEEQLKLNVEVENNAKPESSADISDAVSVESNVEEQTQTHPQLETSNFGTGMSHTSNADFKTQIESNEKIRLSPNLENSSQMRLSPPKTPYEENGKTSDHLQPQLEEARRLAKKLLASTTTDAALKLSSGLNDSKEINKVVTNMTQEETAIKDAKSTNGVPSTVEKKDFLKSDSENSPSLATNDFELIVANESVEDHMTTEEEHLTNIKYNPLQLSTELKEIGNDSQVIESTITDTNVLTAEPQGTLNFRMTDEVSKDETVLTKVDLDVTQKTSYDPLKLHLEINEAKEEPANDVPKDATNLDTQDDLTKITTNPDAGTLTQFDVSKLHSEVANAAEISTSPVPEEESKTVHVKEEQLTNIKYNPLHLSVELEEVGKDSQTTFDTSSPIPDSELIVDLDKQEDLTKITYDPLQLSLELKKTEDDSTIPIGILSPADFNVTVADPDAGTVTQFDVSKLHSEVANAAEISTSPISEEESKTEHVEEKQLTNIKYNPLQLSAELEEVGKDSQTTFDTLSSKPESELIVDFDTQEELAKNTYDPLQLSLELKKAEDDSTIPIGILSPAELNVTVADPDAGTVTQFDVSKLHSEVANAAEISASPVPEEESKTVHVEEEQLTNIKYNPLQLSVELEEVGKDSQTTFDTSSPVPDSELIVDLDKQEDLTKITYDPLQLSLELKKTEDDSTIPIGVLSPAELNVTVAEPDAGTVTQFDVSKLHSEVANAAEISDSPVPEEESKTVHVEEEQLTNIKYNPLQLSVELEEVGKDSQTTFDTSSPIPDSELIVTEPEFINIKYNPLELNMELQKVQEIAKTELEPNQLSEVVQMVHENPDSINYEQKNDVTNGDKQENLSRNMYNPLQLNMELKEVEKDSTAEFGLLSPNNSNTVKTDLDENVTTQFDSSNLHSEVTKAAEGPSHFIPSEEHKVAHIDDENLTNVKYNPLELSAELKEAGKDFLIELDEASPKHKLIEEEISNNMVIENVVNVKYDPSKLSTELKEAEKSSETLFDTSSNKHPNINEDDKNLNSTVSYDTEKLHLEISEAVQAPKIFNTSEKDVESDSAQVFSISTEPDSIVVEEKMSNIDFDSSKLRAELEAATNSLQLTEILPEVEVTKEIATSFDVATLRLEVKDAETHKENSLEIISDDKKWNDVDEPKTSFDILKLRSELSDDSVEDDAIKLNTFQDESHQEHNKGDATENTESKSVDLFQLHQEIEQANNGLISENNESEVINGSKLLTEDNELNGNKSNVDQTAVETTESLITPSINESDAPNYITNINKQITKPTHIHETKLDQSNLNMKINDPKESKHLNLDDERERPLSKNSTASTDSTSTIIFNADAAVDPSYADLDNISPKFSRKRNASLTEKSLALVLDQQLVLAAPSVLKKKTVETESPEYIYIPLRDASHDEISSIENKYSSQEVEHDKLQLEEEFVMIDEPIISPRTISKNESAVEKVLGSVTDQQLAIAVPNLKIERKEASDELAEPNYIYIPLKNPDTEHVDSEENDDTENLTISSIGRSSKSSNSNSSIELNNNKKSKDTFDISKLRTEVEEATKYSNRDEDPASRAHSGNSKGKSNNGLKNNQLYTYEYQHTVHTDDKSNQVMDVATIIETTQISDDGVPLAVQLNQGQGQVFIIIDCNME